MFGTLTLRVPLLVAALAVAGGIVGYAAARPPGAGAAPTPQVDRVALVQQWFEARNQGDADAAMAMLTADAVLAHGPCPLATPCVGEANRAFIASGTQHTVLTMQESGSAVVGRIGVFNPEGWPGFEVGWGIDSEYRGKGYAVEAAQASIDWVFATFEIGEIIHCIEASNEPSKRVARRLGARHDGEVGLFGKPSERWVTSRASWKG